MKNSKLKLTLASIVLGMANQAANAAELKIRGHNKKCAELVAQFATSFIQTDWDLDELLSARVVRTNAVINGVNGLTQVEVTALDGGHDEGTVNVFIAPPRGTAESTCYVQAVAVGVSFTP